MKRNSLNGKHVFIANTPGIGDIIMCTPAFRKLKESYPECILTVATYGKILPVISNLSYIDEVVGIKGNCIKMVKTILKQDYCCFTTYLPKLAAMAKMMGVPHRSGVCKEKYMWAELFERYLFVEDLHSQSFRAQYIAKQIAESLQIDLQIDEKCDVSNPREDEYKHIAYLFKEHGVVDKPYIVFSPFGKTGLNMDNGLVRKSMQYIQKKYRYITVLLNDKSNEETEEILKGMDKSLTIDLSGRTTLMEMVALLDKAKIVISTDSGPMHIACARETETIAVFSSENPYRWMPKNNCHLLSANSPCSPCLERKKCTHKSCMRGISFEMLKEKIDEVVSRLE